MQIVIFIDSHNSIDEMISITTCLLKKMVKEIKNPHFSKMISAVIKIFEKKNSFKKRKLNSKKDREDFKTESEVSFNDDLLDV